MVIDSTVLERLSELGIDGVDFRALGELASVPDPSGHAARKLALELMGDYPPERALRVARTEMQRAHQQAWIDMGGPGAGLGEGAHPAGGEVSG